MRALKHKPAIQEETKLPALIQKLTFNGTKAQAEEALDQKVLEIKAALKTPRPRKASATRLLVMEVLLLYTLGKWTAVADYPILEDLIKDLLASQLLVDLRLGAIAIGILGFSSVPHSPAQYGMIRADSVCAPLLHLLVHDQPAFVSIALTALLNTPCEAVHDEDLFEEVADLANPIANQNTAIRVKSLALMAKIVRYKPEMAPYHKWLPRLIKTIQLEKHPAVLLGLVRLTDLILVNRTTPSTSTETLLADVLTTLLGITINEEIPDGYSFGGCPTPFLVMQTFTVIAKCETPAILGCADRLGPLMECLVRGLPPEKETPHHVIRSNEMKTAVVLSMIDILVKVPLDTFEECRAPLVAQLVNMSTRPRLFSSIIQSQALRALHRIIENHKYRHIEEFHLLQLTPRSDPVYSYYLSLIIAAATTKKNYPEAINILDLNAFELLPQVKTPGKDGIIINSSPMRVLKHIYREIFNITLYASVSITAIVDQFITLFDTPVQQDSRDPELALSLCDDYLRAMIRLIVGYDFRERQLRVSPTEEETECSSDVHFQLYCLKTIVERLRGLDDEDLLALNEPILHLGGFVLGEYGHCAIEELPITASVSLLSKLVHTELRKKTLGYPTIPSTLSLLLGALVKLGIRSKDTPNGHMVHSIASLGIQKALKESSNNAMLQEHAFILSEGTKDDILPCQHYPRELLLEDIGDAPGAQAKMLADLCLIRRRCDSVPHSLTPTLDDSHLPPPPPATPSPEIKIEASTKEHDGLLMSHWPLEENTVLRAALLGRGFLFENDFVKISLINIHVEMGSARILVSMRVHDRKEDDEPVVVRLKNYSINADGSGLFDVLETTGLEPTTLANGENNMVSLRLRLTTPEASPGIIPLVVKCLLGNSTIPRLVSAPLPAYFFNFYTPARGDFKELWNLSKAERPKHAAKVSLSAAHISGVWKVENAIDFLKRLCVSMHLHVGDYDAEDRFIFHGVTSISPNDLILLRVSSNPAIPGGLKVAFRETGRFKHAPLFARALEGLCTFGHSFNIQ